MNQAKNDNSQTFQVLISPNADRSVASLASAQWHDTGAEGELAVDVYETTEAIIILSPVAGALSESIEVYIHEDLLTIKGQRPHPLETEGNIHYVHGECFWGRFSRTVVLPVPVRGETASAQYRSGVLTIRITKKHASERQIPVTIVEE